MIGQSSTVPDPDPEPASESQDSAVEAADVPAQPVTKEIGGRDGPDPVRYGDWEKNGRCIDF